MYKQFQKEYFFDLSNFEFRDIFDNVNFVWEVLPKIEKYIDSLFQKGVLVANYKDRKNVFIEETSIVHESAEIIGSAIIGKNCEIRHGSFIRGNVILGDNVTVHHGAEIKQSIFLNNSFAPHVGYVGDSIIGNNVNIAAGVILANFRLDKKSVSVGSGPERIDTRLRKFGCIIGDNSSIGVNSVINPGAILGKRAIVYPLTSVTGVHEDDEIIR